MVPRFFAKSNSHCVTPSSCYHWNKNVQQKLESVLEEAEDAYTSFLTYSPSRIICLREEVIEEVDGLAVSWRELTRELRNGYLLYWEQHFQTITSQDGLQKHSSMTLGTGKQVRPKRMNSPAVEYRPTTTHRLALRVDTHLPDPLLLEASYSRPAPGKPWIMQIDAVYKPSAKKWNSDYTQLICKCWKNNSNENNNPFLFTH